MVRAKNGTAVKRLRTDAVNTGFEWYSFQYGVGGYFGFPRTMELTEKEAAEAEFPWLEFEYFPNIPFPEFRTLS